MTAAAKASKPVEDFSHVTFISAGAGSGKTWRLVEELEGALMAGVAQPERVIGATFTVKAAGELKDRVRERLIAAGQTALAERAAQALIGTVHGVCERLLRRFAFERGLSPRQEVLSLEDGARFFNQAVDDVVEPREARRMNAVGARLEVSWPAVVRQVADKARENHIAGAALAAMGPRNADELLEQFPAPVPGDHLGRLRDAIQAALAGIDLDADRTQTTRRYIGEVRDFAALLEGRDCPWSTWISLSRRKAAKASEPLAAAVRDAGLAYAANPNLHEDLRTAIEGVFGIAARAGGRFQALKREAGVIDFGDMEALLLDALDDRSVTERLGAELELLLVDEFQDTNPMQLALFVKLARLAGKAIFVGDVKQAIYEFRGCDQQLVFDALRGLTAGGAASARLGRNWRSRPALTRYVNEVFAAAFAKDGIERPDVVLTPERDERLTNPAVAHWRLAGRGKDDTSQALAEGVAELVASAPDIVDPNTDEPRPLRLGDIAVLARTNDNVEAIASALRRRGVPMKMTLYGLRQVAEVALARAGLRCVNDSGDTLAVAEVMALADGAAPEAWLAERLKWLADGKPPWEWGATHPVVSRLRALRDEALAQSPLEVASRVVNEARLREIVAAWGPDAVAAAQRQRNLDAFLGLAAAYEAHCEPLGAAATLTGFLFWLEAPHAPALDLQPIVTGGDAVAVLTYHRAKGLEWPVVVAADLDYEERTALWAPRIKLLSPFDVNHPLAGRIVRWWPNLFGTRKGGVPVLDAIQASAEGAECARKSASEQRRLAYVGITRARDLLVIALRGKVPESAWLNAFKTPFLLPEGDAVALPSGHQVPAQALSLGAGDARAEARGFAPRWFERREPAAERVPARLRASDAPAVEAAKVVEVVTLGDRVPVKGGDMAAVGNAVHAIIAMRLVNPAAGDDTVRAERIIEACDAAGRLAAADALAVAERFHAWVRERFAPERIHVEHPVSQVLDGGQTRVGWVDVVLRSERGVVIIDHKSSPRPRAEWEAEALSHSGQLAAYADAFRAVGQPPSTWIHLAVAGAALRVAV